MRQAIIGWATAGVIGITGVTGIPAVARAQAQAAEAPLTAVLDQAAAGAEVVVVVPSMSRLSQKIATFGSDTGLDAQAPDLNDALGAFKRQMGFIEGVDDDGAMLVVIGGLSESINAMLDDNDRQAEPTVSLLVPVSDYAAFVQQLGGTPAPGAGEADAQATAITFNHNSGFARKLGGYAVLGDSVEAVQAYAPAEQGRAMTADLGQLVSRYLTGGDALILVDVAALAPSLTAALDKARAQMDQLDPADMGDRGGNWAGMVKPIVNLYERGARIAVNGTEKLVLSLDLAEAGLGLTAATQMKADSELAGFFKPAPGNDAAPGNAGGKSAAGLLASLPDQPYLYAAAVDTKAFNLAAIIDKVNDALGDAGEAGIFTFARESFDMFKQTRGMASVFYAPEPAALMTGGFFNTLSAYEVADAQGFLGRYQGMVEKMGEVKIEMPAMQAGEPAQEISYNTTYTDNALVIDGVEVDQFQINTVLPPAMMQQFGPMAMVMGNAGYGGYVAAKGDTVLMTTVIDPQLITKGLNAADAADGIGSAGAIADLREQALPPAPFMEAYLSLGGIAQTANPFLLMLTANGQQIEVPADLPPMAFGAAAKDDGVAWRMFIPTDLVTFSVDTAERLMPQDGAAPDGTRRAPRAY